MKKYEEFINESTYVRDLAKVKKIIKSCETKEHVDAAIKSLDLLKTKWEDEYADQDVQELERTIEDIYQGLI